MAFICVDLTSSASNENLVDKWYQEITKNGGDKIPIFLIGTKLDSAAAGNGKFKRETGTLIC